MGKQPPGLGKCRAASHPQLIGLGEDNLEDWHESRGLAEVAGADDVCVDVQSLLVVAGLDALHDVVQATNDGWGELQGRQARQVSTKEKPKREILSVALDPQEGAALSSSLWR